MLEEAARQQPRFQVSSRQSLSGSLLLFVRRRVPYGAHVP